MSVNVPAVAAPVAQGGTRILHLHQNVPGVLARVNTILSEGDVNIDSQQLSTKASTATPSPTSRAACPPTPSSACASFRRPSRSGSS